MYLASKGLVCEAVAAISGGLSVLAKSDGPCFFLV